MPSRPGHAGPIRSRPAGSWRRARACRVPRARCPGARARFAAALEREDVVGHERRTSSDKMGGDRALAVPDRPTNAIGALDLDRTRVEELAPAECSRERQDLREEEASQRHAVTLGTAHCTSDPSSRTTYRPTRGAHTWNPASSWCSTTIIGLPSGNVRSTSPRCPSRPCPPQLGVRGADESRRWVRAAAPAPGRSGTAKADSTSIPNARP